MKEEVSSQSTTGSPEETKRLARRFVKLLPPASGTCIGLYGDLGSGKTTFVQGMAAAIGIDTHHYVNSPTFTLINEYPGKKRRMIHVDLYRIGDPREIAELGLSEFLDPPGGDLMVIEWADKLPPSVAKKMLDFKVRFEIDSPTERRIVWTTT